MRRASDWLKVGYDSFGDTVGWVPRDKAIVWNQALTVSFKDPQDIQRVLMFSEREKLQTLVDDYDKKGYQALYDAIVNNEIPADSPVIAIQPEAHLDIRERFLPGADQAARRCVSRQRAGTLAQDSQRPSG